MPFWSPRHPSPVRLQQQTVEGFLASYKDTSIRHGFEPLPLVEKLVHDPLAHARKKNKKAKLWKLKLSDTGMTGGQVKCLAEALVTHPIVASLDLRNNMVGDKGAVALLQAMRSQYSAAVQGEAGLENLGEDERRTMVAYASGHCNLLHAIELEGSGVNMQDESSLLETIAEHCAVMKDVNAWIQMRYLFQSHATPCDWDGSLVLEQKALKQVCKDLKVKFKTVASLLGSRRCSKKVFQDIVAPMAMGCGDKTPPPLPYFRKRNFSVATQKMFMEAEDLMQVVPAESVESMRARRDKDARMHGSDSSANDSANSGDGAFKSDGSGDGAERHGGPGEGGSLGDKSKSAGNGKSAAEAPSPWSSQFSSFHSSLATAPHGRRNSMTRSSYFIANPPARASMAFASDSMRSIPSTEAGLTVQTSSAGKKIRKVSDEKPGSASSSNTSPLHKKAKLSSQSSLDTDLGDSPYSNNEDDMLAEAMRRSLADAPGDLPGQLDSMEEPSDRATAQVLDGLHPASSEQEDGARKGSSPPKSVQAGQGLDTPNNSMDAASDDFDTSVEDMDSSGGAREEIEEAAPVSQAQQDMQSDNGSSDGAEGSDEDGQAEEEWVGVLNFSNRRMNVLKGVGIDWDQFSKRLHTLDLSSNQLRTVGITKIGNVGRMIDTTFPSMPVLKNLNLSKNGIEKIGDMAFNLLPQLERCDLSGNAIGRIAGFETNIALKSLHMQNNRIRVIEGIGQLHQLEFLDLSNNNVCNLVALRPLSLNVGLRFLHMEGNPVSYERRYRSSVISFVPHLDQIDNNPLPPSSAQKAARRAASKREELLKDATAKKKQKRGGSKALRIKDRAHEVMTPSSRNKPKNKRTPESTKKFLEKIQEGKQETKIDFEKELNLLIFERQEDQLKTGIAVDNLMSQTRQIVQQQAYVERRDFLSNQGIIPEGLISPPVKVDKKRQQEWIDKVSEPKFVTEKVALKKRYGFGALPVPIGFKPATPEGAMWKKVSLAVKATSVLRTGASPHPLSQSPVPVVTLRLAELSTPRASASRRKFGSGKRSSGRRARPPWGAGNGSKQIQQSLFEKQRKKAANEKKVQLQSLPGWHTPPVSQDMVTSFRREFRPVMTQQESPALARDNGMKNVSSAPGAGGDDDAVLGIEMVSRAEPAKSGTPGNLIGLRNRTRKVIIKQGPIESEEAATWLNASQVGVLQKIYDATAHNNSGKAEKRALLEALRSEEELGAVAHLPMKTGFVNDGIEEWTTLFDCFVELDESGLGQFSWKQFLYFFTALYLENKTSGKPHFTEYEEVVKDEDMGDEFPPDRSKTLMGSRALKDSRRATHTEDPLAITRMRQWIHAAEQDLSSTLSALEMLLRMYEAGDYNRRSVSSYRHRLVDLEIFDLMEPNHVVRASMESIDESNLEILDDVRSMTARLRDVKGAVKSLLDMMENYTHGEKAVGDHVKALLGSAVGKELEKRKGGRPGAGNQHEGDGKDKEYQYDNVSVASSMWSLEGQSSVNNFPRQSNNAAESNKSDGEKPKPAESNNNYASSTASDSISVGSGRNVGVDIVTVIEAAVKVEDSQKSKVEPEDHLITSIAEHQVLHLHVNGASHLKKVDTFGHSDPYCKVYVNGEFVGKTRHIKNTATPEWNQVFNAELTNGKCDLMFEVFDYDRVGAHDFHGLVTINGVDLEKYFGKHNVPFELAPDPRAKKKKFNRDVGGTLYLSFSVMDDHKLMHVNLAEAAAAAAKLHQHASEQSTEAGAGSNEDTPPATSTIADALVSSQLAPTGPSLSSNDLLDENDKAMGGTGTGSLEDKVDDLYKRKENGSPPVPAEESSALPPHPMQKFKSMEDQIDQFMVTSHTSQSNPVSEDTVISSASESGSSGGQDDDDRYIMKKGFAKLSLNAEKNRKMHDVESPPNAAESGRLNVRASGSVTEKIAAFEGLAKNSAPEATGQPSARIAAQSNEADLGASTMSLEDRIQSMLSASSGPVALPDSDDSFGDDDLDDEVTKLVS